MARRGAQIFVALGRRRLRDQPWELLQVSCGGRLRASKAAGASHCYPPVVALAVQLYVLAGPRFGYESSSQLASAL